jgi:S-adenosylmethionine:tRNA ribosyltransferase-isomerase
MKAVLIADYDYPLPDERIAIYPLEKRDSSKLLVYRNGQISHKNFGELADILPANSHLVYNDTKVIPARIHAHSSAGTKIEIFLLKPAQAELPVEQALASTSSCTWQCIIGNKKRWKENEILKIDLGNTCIEAQYTDYQHNTVTFRWAAAAKISFAECIQKIGQLPIPPYLNRKSDPSDALSYQTVYSQNMGAVAAPTAGLHFTQASFEQLQRNGHSSQTITLHVGAGTFLPVKVSNVLEHQMHNEQLVFTKTAINELLNKLGKIVAVGTTSLRALESLYWYGVKLLTNHSDYGFLVEKLYPYQNHDVISAEAALRAILAFMEKGKLESIVGQTEILIAPGYNFKMINGLITNFHQPKSTLLVLVSAMIGDSWHTVYREALAGGYRFLSYGDSSYLELGCKA